MREIRIFSNTMCKFRMILLKRKSDHGDITKHYEENTILLISQENSSRSSFYRVH